MCRIEPGGYCWSVSSLVFVLVDAADVADAIKVDGDGNDEDVKFAGLLFDTPPPAPLPPHNAQAMIHAIRGA